MSDLPKAFYCWHNRKVVADHDHHTGHIRGFICDSCNTGLGRFKNGDNYLKNAIRYLEENDKLA